MQVTAETVARPENIMVWQVKFGRRRSTIKETKNTVRNFDSVNIKYLNFRNVLSVIYTKLELRTS